MWGIPMLIVGILVPIQIGYCIWLLYYQLGVAAFGGLAFLLVIMPIQALVGGYYRW